MELVYGTLLGDGCLSLLPSGKAARLKVSHCVQQRELVLAKRKVLGEWVRTEPRICENRGFGNGRACVFSTTGVEALLDVYKLFYPNGKKVMPLSVIATMSPRIAAWWLMDDGSRAKWSVRLHTDAFSLEDVRSAATVLTERGFPVKVYLMGGKYPTLTFTRKGSYKFAEWISPFVLPEMRYKIYEVLRPRFVECVVCGEKMPRMVGERGKPLYCKSQLCQKVARLMATVHNRKSAVEWGEYLRTRKCVVCGNALPIDAPVSMGICRSTECRKEAARVRASEWYQSKRSRKLIPPEKSTTSK